MGKSGKEYRVKDQKKSNKRRWLHEISKNTEKRDNRKVA